MAGLLNKWEKGLARTRKGVFDRISDVFRGKDRVDETLMDELEQILIEGDVGVDTTMSLIEQLKQLQSERKEGLERKFRDLLKAELINLVREDTGAVAPAGVEKPHVIFIVGVNGTGKTTTIGKMADRFRRDGKKVLLACADTFRAAAGEQLAVWGKRAGVDVVKQAMGADPASVAFDALEAAMARGVDLLIVDTAGRLHTKVNLMEELKKIQRVLKKRMDTAPHEVLLTLDATTGQNGLNQARLFTEAVGVTGIVLTKLDGTARGGIVVAIRQNLGIPVKWVGVGEGIEDLIPFDAEAFVEGMLG
jgi:fused signal recognition particle receptor